GASRVFGPQKGADEEQIVHLDRALAHFADCLDAAMGLDPNLRNRPGAGAAGGLGYALLALGGRIHRGIAFVLNAVDAKRHFAWADLVITGEGRLDRSTLFGKLPLGVAALALQQQAAVIAVC